MIDVVRDRMAAGEMIEYFVPIGIDIDERRLYERAISQSVEDQHQPALITRAEGAKKEKRLLIEGPPISQLHLAAADARLEPPRSC